MGILYVKRCFLSSYFTLSRFDPLGLDHPAYLFSDRGAGPVIDMISRCAADTHCALKMIAAR